MRESPLGCVRIRGPVVIIRTFAKRVRANAGSWQTVKIINMYRLEAMGELRRA